MIIELISIGYAVCSMIGWGFGDFLAKTVLRIVGPYRLTLYTQLLCLALASLLAAVFPPPIPSSLATIALIIATGICSFSALFFFYRGLALGKASIVTPIVSTSSVIAVGLSFAILGEALNFPQTLCIAAAIAGVLIITGSPDSRRLSSAGIPYAVASMFSIGLVSLLIKVLSADIGEIAVLFFSRLVVVSILLLIAPFVQGSLRRQVNEKPPIKSILIIGVAEFVGFFAFITGMGVGLVSIVTPLSETSPAVTVVLAHLFLRERLTQIQKIGVVMVIGAIVLLSIAST